MISIFGYSGSPLCLFVCLHLSMDRPYHQVPFWWLSPRKVANIHNLLGGQSTTCWNSMFQKSVCNGCLLHNVYHINGGLDCILNQDSWHMCKNKTEPIWKYENSTSSKPSVMKFEPYSPKTFWLSRVLSMKTISKTKPFLSTDCERRETWDVGLRDVRRDVRCEK